MILSDLITSSGTDAALQLRNKGCAEDARTRRELRRVFISCGKVLICVANILGERESRTGFLKVKHHRYMGNKNCIETHHQVYMLFNNSAQKIHLLLTQQTTKPLFSANETLKNNGSPPVSPLKPIGTSPRRRMRPIQPPSHASEKPSSEGSLDLLTIPLRIAHVLRGFDARHKLEGN